MTSRCLWGTWAGKPRANDWAQFTPWRQDLDPPIPQSFRVLVEVPSSEICGLWECRHSIPLLAAMLVRCVPRCASKLRAPISRSYPHNKPQCRRFSMPTNGAPQSATAPGAAMLAPFLNELDRIAPSFKIHGSQIRVLQTPTEFYETLKHKIQSAERRIFLSTLYIGKSEKELVCYW